MTTSPDPSLKLHFPMNAWDAASQKILNLAPADAASPVASGDVKPGVSVVEDDTFGYCMQFDGSANAYIQLPAMNFDFSQGLTVEAWVWYDLFNSWSRIIDFGNPDPGPNNILLANWGTTANLILNIYKSSAAQGIQFDNALQTGAWIHLAVTVNAAGASMYINGVQKTSAAVALPDNVSRANNYIGKSNWSADATFKGKMAHLCLYNRALSADEVRNDMQADLLVNVLSDAAPGAPFTASHPLAFNLYDMDGHAALYIDDNPSATSLTIDLRNVSSQAINLINIKDNVLASATNYHFLLNFRPGVLSDACVASYASAQTIPGWSILSQEDASSGQATLYLLSTVSGALPVGGKTLFSLPLNAASGVGARGTQVEMLPNPAQVQYDDGTGISGGQLAHLQIINHQGLSNLPLRIGFVGSNRVLNDGASPNTLTLEIANLLTPSDRAGGVISLDPQKTLLVLTFVTSPDEPDDADPYVPWALGTQNEVMNIEVSIPGQDLNNPKWSSPIKIASGLYPQWNIAPKTNSLPPEGTIKLQLGNIVSSISPGSTRVTLAYENVPGYWDGRLTCEIEKAPLVYDQEGNVGIGADNPTQKLDVNGGANIAKTLTVGDASTFQGDVTIGPGRSLMVSGISALGGGLRVVGDSNLQNLNVSGVSIFRSIMVSDTTTFSGNVNINAGKSLTVSSPTTLDNLSIKGNVTIDPEGSLTVGGPTILHDSLIISRNVGIGTTTPSAKLEISGDAKVSGALSVTGPFLNDVRVGQASDSNNVLLSWKTDYGLLETWGNSKPLVLQSAGGYVGIGTTSPVAPLHVAAQTASTPIGGYYLDNQNHSGALPERGAWPVSIYAQETIVSRSRLVAALADITSDARAKRALGQSDARADLALLRRLKITDYHWIDPRLNGDRPQKKLIAQEVEAIFPQAVSILPLPTAIPNIYQAATAFSYDTAARTLTVTTARPHDFKPGDHIDLYTDRADLRDLAVQATPSEHDFVVACNHAPQNVFVYGKYVHDFRTIDYDAIAMLTASAAQELARRVEALESECAALRAELKTLAAPAAA